jgi:CspA family cold shock protein
MAVMRGKIKMWNMAKGYGFIARDDNSSDVFVHFRAFENLEGDTPGIGERVEFDIAVDQGRTKAVGVRLLDD